MVDLKSITQKKIAGIPVLYIAAVGVGVLAFVAYRIRDVAFDDAEVSDDTTPEPAASDGGTVGYDGFVSNPVPIYNTAADATGASVDTNENWVRAGSAWAANNDLGSVVDAYTALTLFVQGAELTFDQGKVRDAVVKQFGLPPDLSSAPGKVGPAPAVTKQQGTPPTNHTVKSGDDNNYAKLAALYYGSDSNANQDLLQVANMGRNPRSGNFPVGTVVTIPAYRAPKYHTVTGKTATLAKIAAKNGTTVSVIRELNDGMANTVRKGTRVRVA